MTTSNPGNEAYTSSLTITYGPVPALPKPWLNPEKTDRNDEELARIRTNACDPVIHGLLTPEEFETAKVYRDGEEIRVWVQAKGEEFIDLLWWPTLGIELDDFDVLALRLADHLEDWVCETRFGWGQQRKYVQHEG